MSKILVISPVPSHPPVAGNRARVQALTSALRELGHDLYFMHATRAGDDLEAMRRAWEDRYFPVEPSARGSGARGLYRRLARKLGWESGYRSRIDEWYPRAIDGALDTFTRRIAVDAVLVEYVFMSRALLYFPHDVLKVVDTHDVFADRHRRYLSHGQPPAWFSCSASEEAKGLDRSDTVLAIHDDEAAEFRTRTKRPVVTVGYTVRLRPSPPTDIVPGRILSVGSDNPINLRSLEWFVAEVLPLVRRERPDAELAVAGTICRELTETAGTRLLGPLADLAPAYASAEVVVNPMLFGTGLKIKTLEALGFGRALVTTPCGAAGLSSAAGAAFKVGADAATMAAEIIELLADPARARALGDAGHRFAAEYNLSIDASLKRLFGGRL